MHINFYLEGKWRPFLDTVISHSSSIDILLLGEVLIAVVAVKVFFWRRG
jgi:hypothetical protein